VSSLSGFDSEYTSTNFRGFALSVDIVGGDHTLGANWQTLSLGSVSLQAEDIEAGGYQQSRFQVLGQLAYGDVTLTRPWTPNQSGWIAEWFALAEQYGPTTVAVTINYLDVSGKPQKAVYNFRNAYPVTWTQPNFAAVPSDQQPPSITESLTFSHAGFFDTNGLTPGIQDPEAVQVFRLMILPGTAGVPGMASALASLTNWTPMGAVYGTGAVIGAISAPIATQAVSTLSMLGPFPSITFWVPPSSMSVSKSANWSVNNSPNASGSGPVTWGGTDPLDLSFDFILDSAATDSSGMETSKRDGERLAPVAGPAGSSVLPVVEQLLGLCEVDPLSAMLGMGSAPLVMLLWGDFVSPLCYVSDVQLQFTKFNANGEPIRATGTLSLSSYPIPDFLQNPTSGGELPRRSATLYDGDSLAHVAYRAYQDPARWRDVAEVNGIDDPLRAKAGSQLLIPAAQELPPRTETGRLGTGSRMSGSARRAQIESTGQVQALA
jgi:hypothetical protein